MIVRARTMCALGVLVLLGHGTLDWPGGIQTARADSDTTPWQTTVASGKDRSRPAKASKRNADGEAHQGGPTRAGLARQSGVAVTAPIETGSVERTQGPASDAPVLQPVATKAVSPGLPDAAKRFCINIKPQVEELRTALQKKKLMQAEEELQKRITQLETRIREYKEWMERRQDFVNKVQDSLVKIYSKMRPEAVAQQLPSLDQETAAAVLLKLEPRTASAILNDTEPKLAATLASIISNSAQPTAEPDKSNAATP